MVNTILADLVEEGYVFLGIRNSLCDVQWGLRPSEKLTQTVVTMIGTLAVSKDVAVLHCLEKLQNDLELDSKVDFSQYKERHPTCPPFGISPTSKQRYFAVVCSKVLGSWADGRFNSTGAGFGFEPAEFESCIAFLLEYIFNFDAEEKIKYLKNLQKTKRVLVQKTLTTSAAEILVMRNFLSLQKTLKFVPLAKEFIKEILFPNRMCFFETFRLSFVRSSPVGYSADGGLFFILCNLTKRFIRVIYILDNLINHQESTLTKIGETEWKRQFLLPSLKKSMIFYHKERNYAPSTGEHCHPNCNPMNPPSNPKNPLS